MARLMAAVTELSVLLLLQQGLMPEQLSEKTKGKMSFLSLSVLSWRRICIPCSVRAETDKRIWEP